MFLSRNKLYLFLSILCTSGYFWMYFNLTKNPIINTEVCLFKHVTKIPCPSCGSSRSITQIIKGNIQQALYLNPLGFISAFILLITYLKTCPPATTFRLRKLSSELNVVTINETLKFSKNINPNDS